MDQKEKAEFLANEKEKAFSMVKTASFNGAVQDPYPSPFLNLSDTQIPKTSREIFAWCKYFYTFDPLIAGAINALSTFPVTELHLEDIKAQQDIDEDSDILKTYKRVLHKNLNIHKLLIEIGIDYYLYGNCFVFGEMHTNPVTGEKEWKHMVRLDPAKITIDYNPATQEKIYKWEVPASVRRIVNNKKPKEEYDKIPDVLKKAVIQKKSIILNSNNIYHFARATDSMGDNNVWGTPVIANVLKLLMYRNVLRQAQEAIAREHIVPMRVYYLERTQDYNLQVDWNKVANDFAGELMKTTRDPNHKVVSPVPVNMLNVGGQGRSLLLTPEIEQIQGEILAGMNVPREFIFGGVSYSGSSISLKILENQFITYRVLLKDFVQEFIIKGMAKARKEWVNTKDDENLITVKMNDLKMQDDVQQKSLVVQLNGAGKCTNDYMWRIIGMEPDKMKDALEKEALAAIQLESELNQARMRLQLKEMDLNLELQKKQIEMQAALNAHQILVQQKVNTEMPELNNMAMEQQGIQQGMQQQMMGEQMPQEQIPQEQVPQEQMQEAPVNQEMPTEEVPAEQEAQVEEAPDVSTASPEIKRVALQLMKLPAAFRDTPISKFPQQSQNMIRAIIQQLESAEDTKQKLEVDMRPMPEKLPPRRDSLK